MTTLLRRLAGWLHRSADQWDQRATRNRVRTCGRYCSEQHTYEPGCINYRNPWRE